MIYSPLRYPGGKNKLAAFVAKICIDNNVNGHYIEPYAGGSSVALFLLLEDFVNRITINDKDRSIYAFWHSVLNKTDLLCERIYNCELSIKEWYKQKEVQKNKNKIDLLDLGFSTFYLNRTNRSGIINGGVIGGSKQNGNYLMDCRFNKAELIKRIRRIASRKKDIRLYKKDALSLIEKIQREGENNNVIFYFDPPYYLKANSLYMNYYQQNDHKLVSEAIKKIENHKWIVSYDNLPQIQKLYDGFHKKEYSFRHTAYESREGKEVLFFSNDLRTPEIDNYNPIHFKTNKKKTGPKIIYKPI